MTDERTPLAADRPMTTAGLQAKVRLRRAWFEAHPNQPIPEGRAEVERLFAAIESEAAGVTVSGEGLREENERLRGKLQQAIRAFRDSGGECWFCYAKAAEEHESNCRVQDFLDAALAASPGPAALDVERLARAGGLFARIDALNAALTALNAALALQSDTPEAEG